MAGEFLDSNALLYLTSAGEVAKAEKLLRGRPAVSVQVLNEVANVSRNKFKWELSEIKALLDDLVPLLDVHAVTEPMHREALRLVVRYKLRWWDSLLLAAALSIGCTSFHSEDMQEGLVVDDRLTIVDPFA